MKKFFIFFFLLATGMSLFSQTKTFNITGRGRVVGEFLGREFNDVVIQKDMFGEQIAIWYRAWINENWDVEEFSEKKRFYTHGTAYDISTIIPKIDIEIGRFKTDIIYEMERFDDGEYFDIFFRDGYYHINFVYIVYTIKK